MFFPVPNSNRGSPAGKNTLPAEVAEPSHPGAAPPSRANLCCLEPGRRAETSVPAVIQFRTVFSCTPSSRAVSLTPRNGFSIPSLMTTL